ncbi:ABC transporter permease [Natronospira bacteriovora]|uniref:ABC transporter permease n=1 Tax=Natronospira bacteriovora TaxID=3069753 RepID=A0ABU0W7J4_9GAMM|nr:ABC transporter permease [Natronospira sp. AB-CW4]MDQ2069999.1 ABC transporter permease [Natronospira sp. AB-CW4]
MMHRTLALLVKELKVLARDPHGLLVLFAMPAVFILVMSIALQDVFNDEGSVGSVQLRDDARDELSLSFREHLAGRLHLLPAEDAGTPGRDEILLILDDGFDQRLLALVEEETTAPALRLLAGNGVDGRSLQIVNGAIQMALGEALSDVEGDGEIGALLERLGRHAVEQQRPGRADPGAVVSSVQQSVPAWLVFGMFFVVIPLSTVLIGERQQGTLSRLRLTGVGPMHLLLSKVPAYLIVNLLQLMLMLAIGFWLVPLVGGEALSAPASALALLLVALSTGLAAIGFALLVGVIARTHMQATTVGGVFNIIFAAAGGIMVPRFVMADSMHAVAWLSPMGWALDGFLDAFLRTDALAVIALPITGLLAFGTVCLLLAMMILARRP